MRTTVWMLAGALSLLVAPMMAAEGDSPGSDQLPWARWQGRLSLGTQSAAWPLGVEGRSAKITSGSVVGDYYFTRSLAGAGRLGGFRATSGLITSAAQGANSPAYRCTQISPR